MRLSIKGACLPSIALVLFALGCSGNRTKISAMLNQNASLVGQLPVNPLQSKIITSTIDRSGSTMSTIYGNDIAVEYIRTHSQHDYPPGSVLSVVTWAEQEDPRWFGARIPGQVKSVEFVTVRAAADGRPTYTYRRYEGAPLTESASQDPVTTNQRVAYLVSLRAAVMP